LRWRRRIGTTRRGDRTALGFTIGRSRISDVRRRYPRLLVERRAGGRTITFAHFFGYESGEAMVYRFDTRGLLVELQTDVFGC